MSTRRKILRGREDEKGLTMADEIEFFAVGDEPRTVLRRTFAGPIDEVFRAWTDATILQVWYGPFDFDVRECVMDFRDGGRFRIVMAHEGGLVFVTTGNFDNIIRRERFTMVTDLGEHPSEFVEIFRPRNADIEHVPIIWNLEVGFEDLKHATRVTITTTYPLMADRDQFVAMHGEHGWAEGFVKLDRLLGA
jgi:uncharacterized protein YndB with AHSA1/START domain